MQPETTIENKLKNLIRKRGSIKGQQTSFRTFLDKINKPIDNPRIISQLNYRIPIIKELIHSFNEIQSEIELLVDDSDYEATLEERNNFESQHFELLAEAAELLSADLEIAGKELLPNHHNQSVSGVGGHQRSPAGPSRYNSPTPSESISQVSMPTHGAPAPASPSEHVIVSSRVAYNDAVNFGNIGNVRLPTLTLEKFDGRLEHFSAFADAFKSLVHNNEKLDNVARFLYLRSSLSPEPLKVIEAIEVTDSNYPIAWNLLENRYRNKRLAIHNHIKAIVEFQKIPREAFVTLRQFVDTLQSHTRSLKALGQPVEYWDTLLIHIATDKLAYLTKKEWEIELEKDDPEMLPNFPRLTSFLERRCRLLQKIDNQSNSSHDFSKFKDNPRDSHKSHKHFKTSSHVLATSKRSNPLCPVCTQQHWIYQCKSFIDMPVSQRQIEVDKHELCSNCLRKGHQKSVCRSSHCRKCSQPHSTFLHVDTASSLTTLSNHAETLHAFEQTLATAQILLTGNDGTSLVCTALLDCGSMRSYISRSSCQKLNLTTTSTNIAVVGINESKTNVSFMAQAKIRSLNEHFEEELNFLVLPRITDTFSTTGISTCDLQLPADIKLANNKFSQGTRIDVLLGVDIFWRLIKPEQPYLAKYPFLINTVFGYIISGNLAASQSDNSSTRCNVSLAQLSKQITLFWEQENCERTEPFRSLEEQHCEENFVTYTTRDPISGRFIVKLPLSNSPSILGNSRTMAIKQFYALEKRLLSKPDIRAMYVEFMEEYVNLGHMIKITDHSPVNEFEYYMPHHPVIKAESLTTKCRVVFNSSSPSSNGLSLNDIQMNGPTIQNDLFTIILRFRRFKYVLSADCSKMFRCVLVYPEHRPLQKIVWRSDPSQPLDTYQLCTVTYGQKASSFLAIRCLFELAKIHQAEHPLVAETIRSDMYCDDLLTSIDSLTQAQYMCETITQILQSAGFVLRKWATNKPELLSRIEKNDISNKILEFGSSECTKTLGLLYSPFSDEFFFKIKDFDRSRLTKRLALSIISQIFDPLGILGPCTITAKIFIQQLWEQNLSWDAPITGDLLETWSQFTADLPLLNHIRIPRQAIITQHCHLEMHCYCDASLKAFAGCVILKSRASDGTASTHLLCSKSKLAPLKTITVPKLELNAALLLAKLAHKVHSALQVTVHRTIFWTDSKIALAWIKTEPHRLKMYVANRVSQIRDLSSPDDWRYTPTDENPADLLTRGIRASQLAPAKLWWHGPSYLIEQESEWPAQEITYLPLDLPELKNQKTYLLHSQPVIDFPINRYSTLLKLQRVTAYCLRFIKNCKLSSQSRLTTELNCHELQNSLHSLIKISQIESFPLELNLLGRQKQVKTDSKLSSLNPFFDESGIIRVGGRLGNSPFAFERRHPIILTNKHHFTKLLFQFEHKRLQHAGPQLLLAATREKYWTIGGRSLAKLTVHNCIQCFRAKPRHIKHILGHLPSDRVTPNHPFEIVGSDFAGPIYIKDRPKARGAKLIKAYILLFVCFTTKAVHLEIVSSLSTDSFILALRRFAARRGMPAKIYSDNGKTYVGANSQLRELGEFLTSHKEKLQHAFVNEHFNWTFIPPYTPHMGGLWESGIKSTKQCLKRALGNTSLDFEHLYSLIIQIEGVLNSRPLFPISSHPDDLHPITPAHLLIGRSITTVPDPDVTHIAVSRTNVYQHIQSIVQHFWKRWSAEYLVELQRRTKWKQNAPNVKIGTLVLIKDDKTPPTRWQMGRVIATHPGNDNIVRVVSLKTAAGTIRRSTSRLCALPIEDYIETTSVSKCLCVGLMSLCKCNCAYCNTVKSN